MRSEVDALFRQKETHFRTGFFHIRKDNSFDRSIGHLRAIAYEYSGQNLEIRSKISECRSKNGLRALLAKRSCFSACPDDWAT